MKWKSNFGRLYLPYRMLSYMILVSGDKNRCKHYELRSIALIRPVVKVKFEIDGVKISITQSIRKSLIYSVELKNIILEELEKESRRIYGKIFISNIFDVMIKLEYNE